jgi:secreted trypsin-like serine protease
MLVHGLTVSALLSACSAAPVVVLPNKSCPAAGKADPLQAPVQLGIVNGQVTQNNDNMDRATVALQIVSSYSDGRQGVGTCTAVVVSRRILISAGHCFAVRDQETAKQVFAVTSTDLEKSKRNETIAAAKFTVHPEYNGSFHDIAVVELRSDLPALYSPTSFALDLATLTEETPVVLIGFGQTSDQDNASAGIKRRTESMLDKVINRENFPRTSIVNQIRVFDRSGENRGACFGDSGGPGFIKSTQQVFGVVQGVNSTVQPSPNPSCMTGDANYTMIAPYREWIEQTAKIKLNSTPQKNPAAVRDTLDANGTSSITSCE